MEAAARLEDYFFLHVCQIRHKISLSKEIFTFSQRH